MESAIWVKFTDGSFKMKLVAWWQYPCQAGQLKDAASWTLKLTWFMSIFQLGPSPSHPLCEPQFPPLNCFFDIFLLNISKLVSVACHLEPWQITLFISQEKINLVAPNCRHTGSLDIRAQGPAFTYARKGLALDICMSCSSWTFRTLLNAAI